MKRIFDIFFSFIGLGIGSIILIPAMFAVYLQDFHSPFYIAPRVGKNGKLFRMVKLRSMVMGADKSKVDSTSANDSRITVIGQVIRKFKLDELTQLWNVLKGDMSLVGPRPNVERETDLYTAEERGLLEVRPGITDFSSIVFSDEGDILEGSEDPDLKYNQVIRPWKSRLGLVYVKNSSLVTDVKIILITIVAIVNRPKALKLLQGVLVAAGVEDKLIKVAARKDPLEPFPPPGSDTVVSSRS
jgi:lipopolysaccharide/colanic/teichoic acid biosynthesis glycosyltransferase